MPSRPSPLHVRPAHPDDAATIVDFNAAMADESEDMALDTERLRHGVAAVFADPARGRYLIAERDDAVVGQLMVTLEWSDWRNGWFWWIQSVYVVPEHRRSGVFRALYAEVDHQARASGTCCGLRLYVERENRAAHGTYEAVGMERCRYDMFEAEHPLPTMG